MLKKTATLALASLLGGACAHAFVFHETLPMTPEAEPHDVIVEVDGKTFNPGGLAEVFYDSETNFLYWEIQYSGLTGPAWGLHFHVAEPGKVTGPIGISIFNIPPASLPPMFDDNPTFGFYNGSATVSDDFEAALLEGRVYINLHTTTNLPGEIRTDIPAIPEPAALGLLGLGALSIFIVLRRR